MFQPKVLFYSAGLAACTQVLCGAPIRFNTSTLLFDRALSCNYVTNRKRSSWTGGASSTLPLARKTSTGRIWREALILSR